MTTILLWLFLQGPDPAWLCDAPTNPARYTVGLVWIQGDRPALGFHIADKVIRWRTACSED